jgi:hypothetical protein
VEWELANVNFEDWGNFGRGWSNERMTAHVVSTPSFPVIAFPKAWTPGTNGIMTADVVTAVMTSEADFEKFRGKLKGKIAMITPMREVPAQFQAPGRRYTDEELKNLSTQPVQTPGQRGGGGGNNAQNFNNRRLQFLMAEGVLATLEPGPGDGGTVFVQTGASRAPDAPPTLPQLVLAVEHYGRMWRMIELNVPVTIELNVDNRFYDDNLNAYNIIAEIPGTDKADEVVMLGGHFDSWHTGTGATDNAAGCAVMMEAVRILKATGLRMRRTVRLALWTGEEQGLLGSRAYVTRHFADRQDMKVKPEHAKFQAYFNVDNGTGAIRGIYLQGNEAVAPIFKEWMGPFENMGMSAVSIRGTGGTDHLNFDAVGLPGFQFIQDQIEYNSRTHHSSMDVYERIQPADMMKNAVIVASFVYHAANRDTLLPRKPLPRPQPAPAGQRGGQ